MTKVALSGAGGKVGTLLRPELLKRGIDLRSAGGRRPLEPLVPGEDVMHGDLRDSAVVDRLLDGVDVLVHMAGTAVERPLPEVYENNLRALLEVYEGARRHKLRRVVFASTNHAFGMYPVQDTLTLDCPYRPDGIYGLSKVWGEGLARLYWDKHGIESICARIGSVTGNPPTQVRHLSTWLGTDDLVHLIMQCITVPDIGFLAVWGVSANTRSYWSNAGSERLGFIPRQNAEDYAAQVLQQTNPLGARAQTLQGGSLAALDFTPEDQRPGTA